MKKKSVICLILGHKWTLSEFDGDASAHCERCSECIIHLSKELKERKLEVEVNRNFKRYRG